jgi:hypothetical protein
MDVYGAPFTDGAAVAPINSVAGAVDEGWFLLFVVGVRGVLCATTDGKWQKAITEKNESDLQTTPDFLIIQIHLCLVSVSLPVPFPSRGQNGTTARAG